MALAAESAQPGSNDEVAIRALEDKARLAVLTSDIAALEELWSESFIVNNPENQILANRTAVLDRVHQGQIHYSKFEREIEAIRFAGDIAIVMGAETVLAAGAAEDQVVHRRFTNVWRREGSTWRAIARHANVIPRIHTIDDR